mmetsp:Transcript_139305/g.444615  ORF Transcript_139305/g.444615 Transcript_139305/m.444615 type:complete len:116 (+) Transcript_139305:569-916(+)
MQRLLDQSDFVGSRRVPLVSKCGLAGILNQKLFRWTLELYQGVEESPTLSFFDDAKFPPSGAAPQLEYRNISTCSKMLSRLPVACGRHYLSLHVIRLTFRKKRPPKRGHAMFRLP